MKYNKDKRKVEYVSKRRFWNLEANQIAWLNVLDEEQFVKTAIDGRKREWELGYGGKVKMSKEERNEEQERFERIFVWVSDSGALSHMCSGNEGFVSYKRGGKAVANFVNNGNESESKMVGKWKGRSYHPVEGFD